MLAICHKQNTNCFSWLQWILLPANEIDRSTLSSPIFWNMQRPSVSPWGFPGPATPSLPFHCPNVQKLVPWGPPRPGAGALGKHSWTRSFTVHVLTVIKIFKYFRCKKPETHAYPGLWVWNQPLAETHRYYISRLGTKNKFWCISFWCDFVLLGLFFSPVLCCGLLGSQT